MRRNDTATGILIICMMLLVMAGVVYGCLGNIGKSEATLPRMEPLTATYTNDSDCIKAYLIRDPDTGIEYLVTDHGGITPRIKKGSE